MPNPEYRFEFEGGGATENDENAWFVDAGCAVDCENDCPPHPFETLCDPIAPDQSTEGCGFVVEDILDTGEVKEDLAVDGAIPGLPGCRDCEKELVALCEVEDGVRAAKPLRD